MDDFKVSGLSVVAGVLWVGAGSIVLVAFWLRDANLGDIGIVLAVGAAMMTANAIVARQRRMFLSAVQMGRRDAWREDARVRHMR